MPTHLHRTSHKKLKFSLKRGAISCHVELLAFCEQQVAVPPDVQLSSLRLLPPQFVELPPSGMSILAEGCRAVGLHALFMTAMKIYS